MRIAIGADHAGFQLKDSLAVYLRDLGHEVFDTGTNSGDPVDYSDYAEAVGRALLEPSESRRSHLRQRCRRLCGY
jgi:ribose 5-phosphate isomerase RpiB